MASRPGAGREHRHPTSFQNTAQREDVANVIVHNQHLLSDKRLIGSMQAVEHPLLLRRQVGNHAMQEERRLVEQTFR